MYWDWQDNLWSDWNWAQKKLWPLLIAWFLFPLFPFQCYTSFLEHCSYESWRKIKLILYSSTLQFGSENIFFLKNDSFTKRLSVNMEKTLLSEVLHMGVGWIFGSANNCKMPKLMSDSIDQRSCENGTPTRKHRSLCIKKNKNSVSYMESLSFFLFQGIFLV